MLKNDLCVCEAKKEGFHILFLKLFWSPQKFEKLFLRRKNYFFPLPADKINLTNLLDLIHSGLIR